MKVSKRIEGLRSILANATIDEINRTVFESWFTQLEVDVVEALQTARQDGYNQGWDGYAAYVHKIRKGG